MSFTIRLIACYFTTTFILSGLEVKDLLNSPNTDETYAALYKKALEKNKVDWHSLSPEKYRVKAVYECPQEEGDPIYAVTLKHRGVLNGESANPRKGLVQFISPEGHFFDDKRSSFELIADLNKDGSIEYVDDIGTVLNCVDLELLDKIKGPSFRQFEIFPVTRNQKATLKVYYFEPMNWQFVGQDDEQPYQLEFFQGHPTNSNRRVFARYTWSKASQIWIHSSPKRNPQILESIQLEDEEAQESLNESRIADFVEYAKDPQKWLWNEEGDITIYGAKSFFWSEDPLDDDYTIKFTYRGREAILLLNGNGKYFDDDTLVLTLSERFQSLRQRSIFESGKELVGMNERFNLSKGMHFVVSRVGPMLRVKANGKLLFEYEIPEALRKPGLLGLYHYKSSRGDSVYSDLVIE